MKGRPIYRQQHRRRRRRRIPAQIHPVQSSQTSEDSSRERLLSRKTLALGCSLAISIAILVIYYRFPRGKTNSRNKIIILKRREVYIYDEPKDVKKDATPWRKFYSKVDQAMADQTGCWIKSLCSFTPHYKPPSILKTQWEKKESSTRKIIRHVSIENIPYPPVGALRLVDVSMLAAFGSLSSESIKMAALEFFFAICEHEFHARSKFGAGNGICLLTRTLRFLRNDVHLHKEELLHEAPFFCEEDTTYGLEISSDIMELIDWFCDQMYISSKQFPFNPETHIIKETPFTQSKFFRYLISLATLINIGEGRYRPRSVEMDAKMIFIPPKYLDSKGKISGERFLCPKLQHVGGIKKDFDQELRRSEIYAGVVQNTHVNVLMAARHKINRLADLERKEARKALRATPEEVKILRRKFHETSHQLAERTSLENYRYKLYQTLRMRFENVMSQAIWSSWKDYLHFVISSEPVRMISKINQFSADSPYIPSDYNEFRKVLWDRFLLSDKNCRPLVTEMEKKMYSKPDKRDSSLDGTFNVQSTSASIISPCEKVAEINRKRLLARIGHPSQ